MSTIRSNRRAALFAAGLPLAALAALLAVFVMWAPGSGGGHSAEAATDPSVDLSISSTGCNSSGSPTATCTVDAGATFTLALNLNHLPENGSYDGYDSNLSYSSGLTIPGVPAPSSSSFCQTNNGACASGPLSGNWPDCVFNASDFTNPGLATIGCSFGIGGTPSTYLGSLYHVDFTCPTPATSQQTITILHGDGSTDTLDDTLAAHSEAADETLTITCGAAGHPTDTPTPCAPNCPTATLTPVPPTPTSTPTGVCGDANGDGSTNSLDSFWVLQLDAGLVAHVPRPELADLNHDGHVNSIDASIMLQIDAGLYHCA
jgi:hypothetical protein